MKVLLINPGRRDYLVQYFLDLSNKFKMKIYIIDPNINIPSFKVSNKTKNFICPKSKNKRFIPFLKNLIKKENIKVIFPLSEYELKKISKQKNFFKKKGIEIIVSDQKIIEICQKKLKTYDFLKKIKIKYPELIKFNDLKKKLPVIGKEVKGNSSKNQIIINTKDQIPKKKNKLFFQKYIRSDEYGMDILNDLNGNFVHTCIKKKYQIRAGDTDKAKIINPKNFLWLAKKISSSLKHVGNLDIDFICKNRKVYILDLNARFGGGYPFTHEYGYNYIERILELIKKRKKLTKFKKFRNNKNLFSKGITIYKH